MDTFSVWAVFREASEQLVPPAILGGYDVEFKKALRSLIRRTKDPMLREKFQKMLNCPVVDSRGGCRGFSEYILSALVRQGLHYRWDIEDALSYVVSKMLLPRGESGEPRATLFSDFDEARPYTTGFNPLQGRFMSFLQYAIGNIKRGRIPRLAAIQRPAGTFSIVQGRSAKDEPSSGVSTDEIPARLSADEGMSELVGDLLILLQKKQAAYPVSLVNLFQSILAGETTQTQRKRFGDRLARIGRQVIIRTIEEYAQETSNYRLLRLLDLFQEGKGDQPTPRRTLAKPTKPQLTPGKVKDFISILNVIDRLGTPVGSSDLMKYRRRWVEYPARNPEAGYKNRLEEVLDLATKEGVLRAVRTAKGAVQYEPGLAADQYRQAAVT